MSRVIFDTERFDKLVMIWYTVDTVILKIEQGDRMPIIDYACLTCDTLEEHIVKDSNDTVVCERCGKALEKLVSAPAFRGSGTGFYSPRMSIPTKKGTTDDRVTGS